MNDYQIVNNSPIVLSDCEIKVEDLLSAIHTTNANYAHLATESAKMKANIFKIMDFRMLSGMIGETFVTNLANQSQLLIKNPNMDGYPDLLQNATEEMHKHFEASDIGDFIDYKYGGIEVKNTFGYLETKKYAAKGEQRIRMIKKRLEWKAHHQKTNKLIGLMSDYIDEKPVIVGLLYSHSLSMQDWTTVARPEGDSAMTSFSTMKTTGLKKMKQGLRIMLKDDDYIQFLSS